MVQWRHPLVLSSGQADAWAAAVSHGRTLMLCSLCRNLLGIVVNAVRSRPA